MLLYAFGLPLFVALTLAARQRPHVARARRSAISRCCRSSRGACSPTSSRTSRSPRSPLVASQAGFGAVAARYHRVCLSVRVADPARRRARRRVGAHASRVPGTLALARRVRELRRNDRSFRGTSCSTSSSRSSLPSPMSALAFVSAAGRVLARATRGRCGSRAGSCSGSLLAARRERWMPMLAGGFIGADGLRALTLGVDALDALGYGAIEVLTAGGAALLVSRLTPLPLALDARARARGADRRRRAAARAAWAACSRRRGTSLRAAAMRRDDVSRLGRSPTSSGRCSWRP